MILPCCTGSKPLTVLINVDLPEPEGPQTTTTSPLPTLVVQFFKTRNCPYHFDIFSKEIIDLSLS